MPKGYKVTRYNPNQLAAALGNNQNLAQMFQQMFGGSRMQANPRMTPGMQQGGGTFFAGRQPPRTLQLQKQQSQGMSDAQILAQRKAVYGTEDGSPPWGEGKNFKTRQEFLDTLRDVNRGELFDYNSNNNSYQAYFNELGNRAMSQDISKQAGMQDHAEWAAARQKQQDFLDKFKAEHASDPVFQKMLADPKAGTSYKDAAGNWQNWSEQDYKDHGYTLWTDPRREKFVGFGGGNPTQWIRTDDPYYQSQQTGKQNPVQLAGALSQQQNVNSAMQGGPAFFSGQTPPRTLQLQKQQPQQAAPAQVERPWGEGKNFKTQQEFLDSLHEATKNYQFDWSREDNTPEAYYSQLAQDKMAQEAAARVGIKYQPSQTMQDAMAKYKAAHPELDTMLAQDPSLGRMNSWTEQDYKNHGYTLQEDPLKQKLGLQKAGTLDWVKTPQAAVPPVEQSAPQISQQATPQTTQAQSPVGTQESAVQPEQTQSPAPAPQASYSPQQAANALTQQQALAQAFGGMGKGGQVMPIAGKGGKQLPKP